MVKNAIEITIEKCDIVNQNADVLVNTANSHLNHDGGLAGVFIKLGGQSISDES